MSTYIRVLLDGAGLAVQCDACDTETLHTAYNAAKQAVQIHQLEHVLDRQESR